jgi:transcriptional antiterminator
MIDTLYTEEEREKYKAGLNQLQEEVKLSYKKDFSALSKEEKLKVLKDALSKKEDTTSKFFFDITRNQTIHYFTHTEKYLREIKKYEMAPGRWTACLNIDKIQSKNL